MGKQKKKIVENSSFKQRFEKKPDSPTKAKLVGLKGKREMTLRKRNDDVEKCF